METHSRACKFVQWIYTTKPNGINSSSAVNRVFRARRAGPPRPQGEPAIAQIKPIHEHNRLETGVSIGMG